MQENAEFFVLIKVFMTSFKNQGKRYETFGFPAEKAIGGKYYLITREEVGMKLFKRLVNNKHVNNKMTIAKNQITR